MNRWVVVALLAFGCTKGGDRNGNGGDDSVDWPYTDNPTGSATGSATGAGTGSGTGGTGTGAATGTGTGAGTGTGTGSATGTGSGTGGTSGACVVPIPANTTVVDSNQSHSAAGNYWVCAHEVLSFSGSGATIFVDDQSDLVVNGQNNTVWITSRGDMALFQSNNTVNWESGAAVNDEVGGNTLIECTSLTFDLTNAPSPGC